MKKLIFLLCIFAVTFASAQNITCKVADVTTGQPLPYASIILLPKKTFIYSNVKGEFTF